MTSDELTSARTYEEALQRIADRARKRSQEPPKPQPNRGWRKPVFDQEQALAIREEYAAAGITLDKLARRYNVCSDTIWRVVHRVRCYEAS